MLAFFLSGCAALLLASHYAAWDKADRLGRTVYLVPGEAGATLDARVVPLLVTLGAGAILYAVLLLATERVFSIGQARIAGSSGMRPPRGRGNRLVRTAALLTIGLGIAVAVRWTLYVTNSATPFDRVGIALNSRAPDALRRWGCDRLKATFGANTAAPAGCGQDGTSLWR